MNELKLLRGNPITTSFGVNIYPLTLGEISDIGEKTYNSYVSSFLIDKKVLNNIEDGQFSSEELSRLYKLSDLDFIFYLSLSNLNILVNLVNGLRTVLKTEVFLNNNKGIVIQNNEEKIILNNEMFNEFKKVIIKQNFLKDDESSVFKPANAKAKALLEKLNKAKEKIQNQSKQDKLSLNEIVSIVATYSNDINILSVWDLTVYQLYICYLRLILWDDYHNKYQLIPHSNDINSLDLKHWAIDINKIK